ncbi:HepT-like ribonuclease domain-containing protein [Nitrospira sp. Nam80]
MSRNWPFYLEDVVESARKIGRYTEGLTFDQFRSEDMVIDAVVRNLEIIGEAAKHLPAEAKALMPQVDWSKAAAFRDVIAHGYFGLDLHIIWDVVQTKIPPLNQSVEKVLRELKNRL